MVHNSKQQHGHARTELSTREMFNGVSPDILSHLDERRKEYELLHGPVDVSDRLITELDYGYQCWVAREQPREYLKLVPPFFVDFLREQFEDAIQDGGLDTIPDDFIPVAIHVLKTGRTLDR